MKKYCVSFMCVYTKCVEAETPEEAAEIVSEECPYVTDGSAFVTDIDTGEDFDV